MFRCSLCGVNICKECSLLNNKGTLHLLRCEVVTLLETQTEGNILEAVERLKAYYDPLGNPVGVEFDGCQDDILNGDPGIAKANGKRIIVCDTARMAHFQDDPSAEVPDYAQDYHVKHLTVVVLHEFGHVLNRRKKLPQSVAAESDDKEDRANAFVRYFLDN